MEFGNDNRDPNIQNPSNKQNISDLEKRDIDTHYVETLFKEKTSFRRLVDNFSQRVTVHGVSYLKDSQTIIGGMFWLLIMATAIGGTGYLGFNVMKDFFSWPYTTKIDLVTRFNLEFPAVTICNMNRLRRSKLPGTRFQGLIDIDGGLEGADYDYSWFLDWDNQWTEWFDAYYVNGWTSQQWQDYENTEASASRYEEDKSSLNEEPIESSGDSVEVIEEPRLGDMTSIDEWDHNGNGSIPMMEELEKMVTKPSRNKRNAPGFTDPNQSPILKKNQKNVYMKNRQIKELKRGRHLRKRQAQEDFHSDQESFNFGQFDWWETDIDPLYSAPDFELYDYNWGSITDENDWKGFYKNSKAEDFSDIIDLANPTKEELEELGHQAQDFILQCTFDKRKCNYTDFKVFQNKHYGNCFIFNFGVGDDNPRTTSKSGAQFGLHLTLFIEQPEYVGIFTPESGVRVSVHDRKQKPFPEDDGLTAPPGFATSVGMKQVSISRLANPHGDCTSKTFLQTYGQSSTYEYSTRECRKRCLQNELLAKCHCVTDILLESSKCSVINETQQLCRQLVEALYEEDKLTCSCPTACNEVTYTTSASSSRWPSERYEEHFKKRLETGGVKAARLLDNVEQTRKNFVRLRIYFEELNYQEISQMPVYTVESLLGNIGGLMGLYIGASLFTVVEILVFIFSLVHLGLVKLFGVNKIHATNTVA